MKLSYLIIIVLIVSLFNAFSMRFQAATLFWGKKLQPDNELLPRGMQNAITPSFQNIRNLFIPISVIVIIVLGFIFFEWYVALSSGAVTFILGGLISNMLPKPESNYYYRKIHKVLLKKKNKFIKIDNDLKLEAVEKIISLLDQISPRP